METLKELAEIKDVAPTQPVEVEVNGEKQTMSIPDKIMENIRLRAEQDRGRC